MHRQTILDRRGSDVFTFAGLEDFLQAPSQAQVALGVFLALVTGAQEAVFGKGFGFFWSGASAANQASAWLTISSKNSRTPPPTSLLQKQKQRQVTGF
ncbi:hypothetical protein J3D54_000166 [Pseudomonas sp. GGS8]|nr:hypothetical protein [Pseudomonas sp. GGS8]